MHTLQLLMSTAWSYRGFLVGTPGAWLLMAVWYVSYRQPRLGTFWPPYIPIKGRM